MVPFPEGGSQTMFVKRGSYAYVYTYTHIHIHIYAQKDKAVCLFLSKLESNQYWFF